MMMAEGGVVWIGADRHEQAGLACCNMTKGKDEDEARKGWDWDARAGAPVIEIMCVDGEAEERQETECASSMANKQALWINRPTSM